MIFLSSLTVLACKKCLKVGLILRPIKLKTACQYFLNQKMEIPTTQDILLFRLVLYTIVFVLALHMRLDCSLISSFVCQTYVVILSEISNFKMEK